MTGVDRGYTYTSIYDRSVWLNRTKERSLAPALTVFHVAVDGVKLDPVEINYKDTLGWNNGDPRIAACNLAARLTSSPELVQRATLVAARTLGREQTQKSTIVDVFKNVLTKPSYETLLGALPANDLLTGSLVNNLGSFEGNLLTCFSRIAGTGEEDSFLKRMEALQAVEKLILLRSPTLKTAIHAFMEGVIEWNSSTKRIEVDQTFPATVRNDLERLRTHGIRSFRDAQQKLGTIGITNNHYLTDDEITQFVFREIQAGINNLEYYFPSAADLQTEFVQMDGRGAHLRSPNGYMLFSGWNSREVTFVDDSVATITTTATRCPFPHSVRRGKNKA